MKYLLGIDFGGGATKTVILSEQGELVADSTIEYPTLHPSPDMCEQRPEDWIDALCENVSKVVGRSGISSDDIVCVAVDSATHTSVLTDENCVPLRPAIHWTDTRSRKQANELYAKYGEVIFSKSFHKPDTIWTLCHLLWVKENEPEIFSKIRKVFFEKDYIRYFLTGTYMTDYIEAEGSMLFDCNKMDWDDELCSLCGLKKEYLPPVVNPTDFVGKITKEAARATGLCEGTPVICGTTDTVLEVFAAGAVEEGDVTVKLATAGRICVITSKPYPDRHLVNYSHIAKGLWYPGTATKSAAASYRWYRDTFGGDYRELDGAASKIPIGSEGVVFHPYLNGELTPYADPALCGSFIGIRQNHTRAHFTRAVLEGVSYSLLDSKYYLDSLNIPHKDSAVLIGGGAKGRLWAEITADILGMTLHKTQNSDSSLGSAMLAGIAVGMFASPAEAASKCVKKSATVSPIKENTAKYAELFKEYKAIHDALEKIYSERNR